jgi:hypothetical protein
MFEIARHLKQGLLVAVLFLLFPALQVHALQAKNTNSTEVDNQEPIPFKVYDAPPSEQVSLVVLISLFSVTCALVGGIVLKRNLMKKGIVFPAKASRISIAETKRVSQKVTALLLAVDDQHYLVVQNGENIQIIRHDRKAATEVKNDS